MSDETKPDQLPTTEDETTGLLDDAADFLVDSAIPVPFWKNVAKALRQLSTAAIEWPAAYFEGKAAEKRVETEARIKIIEENTAQITGQMKVPPEYAQRAVKKYGEKILREQSNLDKICAITVNLLKKEKSASSTEQSADSDEEKTINDDWLNSFEEEVRQKSSEEMQLLFGRILAGEIRKPGTYSTRTVKILGQLDQGIASLFRQVCSICVAIEIPIGGSVFDIRVPILMNEPGFDRLGKYGLDFSSAITLQEYGLIISELNSVFSYNLCIVNQDPPAATAFLHQDRYWVLDPLPEWDKNQKIKVLGLALSRAGHELFPIVDRNPREDYIEDLKEFFANQNLQMREVNIKNKK